MLDMFDTTPLLRLYTGGRLRAIDALEPTRAQAHELLRLLGKARNTRFGRDHDFCLWSEKPKVKPCRKRDYNGKLKGLLKFFRFLIISKIISSKTPFPNIRVKIGHSYVNLNRFFRNF